MALFFALACVEAAEPALGELEIVVDAKLPNVLHTSWAAPPGRHRVAVALDGGAAEYTPWSTSSEVSVVGLKSGRSYTLVGETEAEGDSLETDPVDVEIAAADAKLPAITVSDVDEGGWAGAGYTMLSLFSGEGSWLVLVDRDGDYVWVRPSRPGTAIPTAHITSDNLGIVYIDNDFLGYGWGGIGHVTLDGTVDEFRELPNVHHDVIQRPDGGYAWLELESREIVTEEGDTANFTTDVVVDAPSFDGAPRRVFSMFDDYGHTPWHVCSHSAVDVPVAGGEDYTHGNSLLYLPDEGAYVYAPKHLDALVGLDEASGTPIWQAGGRFGDFVDTDGDTIDPDAPYAVDGPHHTWWSHGHLSEAGPDGFVFYDNGSHHSPLRTRAAAYTWDVGARTLTRTWEFSSETGIYDPVLGDVRTLPGGNRLIAWTMIGLLTEVTPDGEVVWRASTELGTAIGRIGYLTSLYGE